jgi:signal transduction histidine kinase
MSRNATMSYITRDIIQVWERGGASTRYARDSRIGRARIADDGPGIPPQFQERIFAIFQTLESRDDVNTSGIGLAIVKKRVQRDDGQIRVESAPPERGATFIFTWEQAAA